MSEKGFTSLSAQRLRLHIHSSGESPISGISSPRICDLHFARLERKQIGTRVGVRPTESRSCDNLLTACKVQKVVQDWTLMKKGYVSAESPRATQTPLSDSFASSPSNRLISVLKASSGPLPDPSRSASVAPTTKMLFRRKINSPPRAATPLHTSNILLSKVIQVSDRLAKLASPEGKKPLGKARPVIEISLLPDRKEKDTGRKVGAKEERRKPRVIEVSMKRS